MKKGMYDHVHMVIALDVVETHITWQVRFVGEII